ncbi:MAG TPA: c-type cytochrome domain-containing protein [Gemmataceae bacterium]|nr:c-type cytochrome domain-containing protein [Gemmataceae bacterium]
MFRPRACCCVFCAILGALLAGLMLFGSVPAATAQAPAKKSVSFINDVAPILKENCYACHDAKKRKGKLEMTSYESFRKGGSKDDPVTEGKSKESVIIDMITATGAGRMPPKDAGDALPKEKIALIAAWIDQGAKLDPGIEPKADLLRELRKRWQPPTAPKEFKAPVPVNSLIFTPDNKQLVIGGYHELLIRDATTGKLEKRISTRAERALAMLFLPDGKLVVAGSRPGQEGDVRMYDISAGTDGVHDKKVFLKEFVQTDDSQLALALSPDAKKLAAAGCDRIIRVWDIASGKLEQSIENHADWVMGLAFSPDGKHLLSASRDKTAKVWDLAAKESLATFSDHQNNVYGVAITPDGKHGISVGEDNNIRIWQATDANNQIGKQTKTIGGHNKAIFRLALNTAGKTPLLATASADGTVRLSDPVAGNSKSSLTGLGDWVYAVAISPDGKLVAGGAYNGEVRVWKTGDAKEVVGFNATPGYVPIKTAQVKKTAETKK